MEIKYLSLIEIKSVFLTFCHLSVSSQGYDRWISSKMNNLNEFKYLHKESIISNWDFSNDRYLFHFHPAPFPSPNIHINNFTRMWLTFVYSYLLNSFNYYALIFTRGECFLIQYDKTRARTSRTWQGRLN